MAEQSNSSEAENQTKRVPLEAMDREKLVQRCRSLLSIAQKAKQARDDAFAETKLLRTKLESIGDTEPNEKVRELCEERDSALIEVARLRQNLECVRDASSIDQVSSPLRCSSPASVDFVSGVSVVCSPATGTPHCTNLPGVGTQQLQLLLEQQLSAVRESIVGAVARHDYSWRCHSQLGTCAAAVVQDVLDAFCRQQEQSAGARVPRERVPSSLHCAGQSVAEVETEDVTQQRRLSAMPENSRSEIDDDASAVVLTGDPCGDTEVDELVTQRGASAGRNHDTAVCDDVSVVPPGGVAVPSPASSSSVCSTDCRSVCDNGLLTSAPSDSAGGQQHRCDCARSERLQRVCEQLEAECERLRERLTTAGHSALLDASPEALNCLTDSDMSDLISQLPHGDENIGDKYQHLRVLAVAMKQKLAQLSEQLSSDQLDKQQLHRQLSAANKELATLRTHVKNIQPLQLANDQLQDQLEAAGARASSLSKQLDQAAVRISQLSQTVAEMSEARDTAVKNIKQLEESVSAEKKKRLDCDWQCQQLQLQLHALEADRNTPPSDDQLANDAAEQLNQLQTSCRQLQQQLEQERELRELCEKEKDRLSELVDVEKLRCDTAVISLNESVRARDEVAKALSSAEEELRHFKVKNATLTQEREASTTQLAELESNCDKLTATNTTLQCQNKTLETRANQLQIRLSDVERQLAINARDFDQYKVRAQTVLKSVREQCAAGGAAADGGRVRDETEQREEVERARAEAVAGAQELVQQLQLQLNETRLEANAAHQERNCLRDDVSRMRTTVNELKHQRKQLELQHQLQVDQLNQLLCDERAALQARIATLNDKCDHLALSQRQSESGAVAALQQQLSAAREQLAQLSQQPPPHQLAKHTETVGDRDSNSGSSRLAPSPTDRLPPSPLDIYSMEREAAEGSESLTPTAVTPTAGGFAAPVSLEKLLTSPLDESFSETESVKRTGSTVPQSHSHATRQLHAQRVQLTHLKALLHESETNNVRLTEMCNTLKEEIRRVQRSVEREKRLEKLEYLKNVTLKFLTLSECDERVRLLPVLSTLLELSPDEVGALRRAVHGSNVSEKSEGGWSSYLHLWSAGPR